MNRWDSRRGECGRLRMGHEREAGVMMGRRGDLERVRIRVRWMRTERGKAGRTEGGRVRTGVRRAGWGWMGKA